MAVEVTVEAMLDRTGVVDQEAVMEITVSCHCAQDNVFLYA